MFRGLQLALLVPVTLGALRSTQSSADPRPPPHAKSWETKWQKTEQEIDWSKKMDDFHSTFEGGPVLPGIPRSWTQSNKHTKKQQGLSRNGVPGHEWQEINTKSFESNAAETGYRLN
eukprot:gnl/MRDRNA2_/MRDRNA2_29177_c1_seq1.p1 gnl/MRDRNA2_/MRDRNA2_29177_c1~~gnl/MRDRNA2_/MRDRNA2_29177_c1_seq1.p1  ORF type:complete len:117 (-),score=22.50 gnl/MRDRNA2_/MRDRNA2_29177_c1_seq1:17-367(-)